MPNGTNGSSAGMSTVAETFTRTILRHGKTAANGIRELLSSFWPSRAEMAATGRPMLAWWGMLAILSHVMLVFAPYDAVYYGRFVVWTNSFLWTLIAFLTTRKTLKMAFPIAIMLAIQLWAVATLFIAAIVLGRVTVVGRHLFFPIEQIMPFFVACGMCVLMPQVRRYAMNIIIGFVFISSLVSLAQFVHFGPAIRIGETWIGTKTLEKWGELATVRSSGLTLHPGIAGLMGALAISAIGAKWLVRRVYTLDLIALLVLVAAAVMAQTRSSLPMIGIAVFLSWLALRRRDPVKSNVVLFLIMVGVVLIVFVGRDRFSYIFETGWFGGESFQHRVGRFEGPLRVIGQFPATGVGPDASMFGSEGIVQDRFSTGLVENAYILFLGMFGIPGLALFVFGLLGCIALATVVYLTSDNQHYRKSIAMTAIVASISVAIWAGVSGIFQDIAVPPLLFLMAGLLVPLESEVRRGIPVLRLYRGGLVHIPNSKPVIPGRLGRARQAEEALPR